MNNHPNLAVHSHLLQPVPKQPDEPTQPFQPKPILSRLEAAAYLGVKPQTLSAWACKRSVNLPYVKAGRRVLYRLIDLEAFCANNIEGLADVGGAK